MRIVHLCLASFYADGYAYQENLLPKYHKQLGNEVFIVASRETFDVRGKDALYNGPSRYHNENGIQVTRLEYKKPLRLYKKLRRYKGVYHVLVNTAPDILFIHGCQFLDASKVVKYVKRHKETIVYVDNHADSSNSATNLISKCLLHGIIWRHTASILNPIVSHFYGVLPSRVDFLIDVYRLPKEKCELLVMGADDELVDQAKDSGIRTIIRNEYGIKSDEFLIVTGGKINKYRPEVLNLMQAIIELNRIDVKLLFFGTVTDELKERFDRLCDNNSIVNVGWVNSEETYGLIEAGDLIVFPGLHSVMWEQAVAQGKPCIFRDLQGFHHVDIGGNALFLDDVSVSGIRKIITDLLDNMEIYSRMKEVAEKKGKETFSYKHIAQRSIRREM